MNKIIILILFVSGALLLVKNFSSTAMTSDQMANFVYMAVLLTFLAGGMFTRDNVNKKQAFGHLMSWLIIMLVFVMLYSFKGDFAVIKNKMAGSLFPASATYNHDGSVSFNLSDDRHFYVNAYVEGVKVKFMVDTGASKVVLTQNDAKRLGLNLNQLDYTQKSYTANGEVWGAPIKIDSFMVGDYELENVSASINSGEMETSLLGMAYLNLLKSYRVEGNILTFEY